MEKQLLEEDWQTAQEGVEVKLVAAPDGVETFVLPRSKDRRSKEKAIHDKFLVRMQEGLEKLKAAADSGRLKDLAVANRRLDSQPGLARLGRVGRRLLSAAQ